jgi:metacaspase-1
MIILLDEENYAPPTFSNIVDAFKILSEESQPGDAVFVQFSGHGGRVLDAAIDSEAESYDEVIVPSDYEQTGLIRDTLIFKTLLAPMRYGVTLTILIDCCDTGMLVELPYAWNSKSDKRGNAAKVREVFYCFHDSTYFHCIRSNEMYCSFSVSSAFNE